MLLLGSALITMRSTGSSLGNNSARRMPKPTRDPMAYDRPAHRLSDDQTHLGALNLLTSRIRTTAPKMNHQVRVGSSHSTLDGLSEFG
ncbi:hypothetical protein I540_5776 [Mycobacteroides abscessus subsp. bolletii 1513]|uniref:Uncharacterized protein n=1 Tax=Mycobacteroides abscessus subsp. bolletii 1513 TaxID=1299321 RepID=X8DDB6_9MYCO|nr:hypothetical protein I540_5776 [Mycobacteroides abscessus subsp. bolletii 1513]